MERVIVHGRDAGLQHLDRAEHGLQVDEPRVGLGRAVGRHLEQHEQLERPVVQRAGEQVRLRMEVAVDQSRHCELAGGFDDRGAFGAGQGARTDRENRAAVDQDVGARVFAVLRVERQDMRIADQGLHRSPVR